MRRLGSLIALAALVLGGCVPAAIDLSLVPNMDATGSGCVNTVGNGPRDQAEDPPGIPLAGIAGLTPSQAAAAAASQGQRAVFRLDAFHCVCVAPTGYGPVSEGWWGSRGQLYIDLEGVQPTGPLLPDGTDC